MSSSLRQDKHEWTKTNIYYRSDRWGEKLRTSERYEPPAPMEFEIYENPGNRSVDEMLEALHRGNEELVPEMVAQWRECMALNDGLRSNMDDGVQSRRAEYSMVLPQQRRPMSPCAFCDKLARCFFTEIGI